MINRIINNTFLHFKNRLTGSTSKNEPLPSKVQTDKREEQEKSPETAISKSPEQPNGASPKGDIGDTRKSADKPKKWNPSQFVVESLEGKSRFHDMELPLPLMHGIADCDFRYCTAVQAESLPHLLKGKDLVANANTGTGKTAVFLIAILTRLMREQKKARKRQTRALVIAPTRELVIQISKDAGKLAKYCNTKIAAVYGGTEYQKQMEGLQQGGADIIVATPGRLLDFCSKNVADLRHVEVLVIDEADRMLDMGFIPDVRRIVGRLPAKNVRQTLMFSATITDEVERLAAQWCRNPVSVAIEPEQVAVDSVDQKVYLVTSSEKYTILYNLIKSDRNNRLVVFTNQKIEAKKLYDRLRRNGINCTLLTGDVAQKKRTDRLERFRGGKIQVLVATDVAGRGLHVEGITHVVNYSLPYEPEDYVHRIGRTGRAGAEGVSVSFACEESSFVLPDIEEFIGRKLECLPPEEHLLAEPPKGSAYSPKKKRRGGRRKQQKGRSVQTGKSEKGS